MKRPGFFAAGPRHPAFMRRCVSRAPASGGPFRHRRGSVEGAANENEQGKRVGLWAVVFEPICLVEVLTMRTESQDYKGFQIQVARNPPMWQASIFYPNRLGHFQ